MKKMLILGVLLAGCVISTVTFASSERRRVPRVMYLAPDNDSAIDLSGKGSLVFIWKSQPVPAGGRVAYKFTLYKDFGYEVVASETLSPKVFEAEVPADKFQDGSIYSWQVKQRDGGTMIWGRAERWSFKVIKK